MTEFNDRVIASFRSNGGHVGAWGSSLVLIHHRGARTKTERVNPAMSLRDGDDWLVVGSAKGAPRDPAWTVNLRAFPEVEIEAVVDGAVTTVPVRATELTGPDREAAFARFVQVAPAFEQYQAAAPRPLPVIRFRRRALQDAGGEAGASAAGTGPEDPARDIAVRRPDSDPSLPHYGAVGDTYTVLLTGADTGGRYGLMDMHIPPGGGPPPHRHDFEEMFHVLEGEIEITFRGETTTVREGETVNIPARAPHFFRNASGRNARMLCAVTPPGLEDYFSRWGEPLSGRTTPPDPAQTAERLRTAVELGPEYAIENL
ncbi:nitroreductase/quinone reductase family protein [Streptomonospora arabica]|uniref:Nitroreductase/quinone reductase family protein n=1 Tax=Streptomonospora arabica TaxID=412417 RepID=A0ABV9SKF1_9ACTN